MRIFSKLLVAAFCLPMFLSAQESKYTMVELSYMKPKMGMEAKFEAAVKAHNEKYHKEGAYQSELFLISTGNATGWYVWVMGPVTYTQLDGRPADKAHGDDWDKTISPFLEKSGRVEYWRWDEKMSNRKDNNESMIHLWFIDVQRGEWYRYQAIMEKVAAMHKQKDEEINVYTNELSQNDGRDVAMVFPMNGWAEFDKEDWKLKEAFDATYGEGAWDDAMKEWENVVVANVQEVWKQIK
jgi:hypothetical protein